MSEGEVQTVGDKQNGEQAKSLSLKRADPIGDARQIPERGRESRDAFTGVILIHGIGDQKRNATLLEAINALSYWFNHHVGLELRSTGQGRVWVTTELHDDDDPDDRASRAILELVAPAEDGHSTETSNSDEYARLEFREVWWAESFGLPKVGPALQWARVQFREQLAHLLLPAGIRFGPAQIARRAPAHEIAQALTYCPEDGDHSTPNVRPRVGEPQRTWLAIGLWVYDFVQYLWKLAQWLVLTPLISLLLLLVGLVRLLAHIPVLQSSLVTSATAVINHVVLHWVASMQVYLLDYGRSAAMRQRFEHEVEALLANPACQRIVVIAHSMGTVISYEGLTTLLNRPEWREQQEHTQKPITYICLSQALRRMWLLSRTDPERLRGVLPERVRWLYFWARYDPVAVGPLSPRALPPLKPGASPRAQAAHKALSARLAQCENVDVVNTDSIYADHTTYWQNLEQVVGPIANELVAGHPALKQLMQEHLATRAEVGQRRWSVAWRALTALIGGFGLMGLLVVLDASNGGKLGRAIAGAVGAVLGSQPVQRFLDNATFGLSTAIGSYLSSCARQGACSGLQHVGQNPGLIVPYLLSLYVRPEHVATAAAALVVLAAGILLVGWLVAAPSPFEFGGASSEAASPRSIFVLGMLALLLVALGEVVFVSILQSRTLSFNDLSKLPFAAAVSVWAIGLGELAWFLALGMGLVEAFRQRKWGWIVGLLAGILLMLGALPFYAMALTALALVGCLALGISAVRQRRWLWVLSLAVVALLLAMADWDFIHPHITVTFGLLVLVAPLVVFGLWAGPMQLQPRGKASGAVRGALGCSVIYLLVSIAVGFVPLIPLIWMPLIIFATLLSVITWGLCVMDAAHAHRWQWVACIVVFTVSLAVLLNILSRVGTADGQPLIQILGPFSLSAGPWLVWSVPFVVAALSYSLWVVPVRQPVVVRKTTRRRFAPALMIGLGRVAAAGAEVTLVASLLALNAIPAIQRVPNTLVFATFPISNASSAPNASATAPYLPFAPPAAQQNLDVRSLGKQPEGITAGPDGNLWFTEAGASKIGRITISGAVHEFPLPDPGSQPQSITAGPDGNLWFTEGGRGTIGRITPAGDVQEFPFSFFGNHYGITTGRDGNLWFTGVDLDTIVRITPTGSIRDFPVADSYGGPVGITTGPDGNLWFADSNAGVGEIGRITPDGAIHKFPLPDLGGQPFGITVGPDGNLWFTEWNTETIGRITPDGAIQEFSLPNRPSGPEGITAGPDGNLWFAEGNAGKIGRITPTGAIREFPLANFYSYPSSITAGPDGNLWFTEAGASKIGRITISGAVHEFPLPDSREGPLEITAGRDGNLWFTEVDAIGRITPSGSIKEFPLTKSSGTPNDITAGPDGNLWFIEAPSALLEADVSKIGRITPSGDIQEFPLPDSGSGPYSITAGPDGNLWFTGAGDTIGRITSSGSIKEFQLSAGSSPYGIRAGPDGNLWFAEVDAIGRITPSGSIKEFPLTKSDSALADIAAGPDGNLWFTEYETGKVGRMVLWLADLGVGAG